MRGDAWAPADGVGSGGQGRAEGSSAQEHKVEAGLPLPGFVAVRPQASYMIPVGLHPWTDKMQVMTRR